ncbi:MAG TPA: CobD/CbiB family protein [Burkholderiales bacterium]|jgi:adenosylcobinamide-phosphate synthase|nr:CobD/CbiB family protein [Burkholderiales bacterium]
MAVIAIIAALLLEQWHPLGDRKIWRAAISSYAEWLETTFNAGEQRHGTIAWLVAVVPPVAGSIALYAFLVWLEPLLALAFNIAALYVTLGFRQFSHYFTSLHAALREGDLDRARQEIAAWRGQAAMHRSREEVMRLAIEQALISSHRHVFGVLFWFVLLPGPSGAILYRLAMYLRDRWGKLGAFGRTAGQVYAILEWPAARLTAAAFAVVGDFEDAVYCWRTQARAWPDPYMGVVLAAGAGAMGVRLGMPLAEPGGVESRPALGVGEAADLPFLDTTVGLLWRALVLWVFVLLVVSAARVL